MLATMTDYQFTPELLAGVAANAGTFRYRGLNVKTGEVNLYGRWTPSSPDLKNLSVWVMFGPGWSYKMLNAHRYCTTETTTTPTFWQAKSLSIIALSCCDALSV